MKRTFYIFILLGLGLMLTSCMEKEAPKIEGMVYIPAGEFVMGSDESDEEALGKEFGLRKERYYEDEMPKRKVQSTGYYIDRYELTNSKYKKYMEATGAKAPPNWEKGQIPKDKEEHPVTYVTWFEAHDYCKWVGKRLPTEQEWERAARGDNGNKYSWGNDYDETKANLNSGEVKRVGSYVDDKSPHGVYDMAGNVMEWVDDWYDAYPDNPSFNKDYGGDKHKVLRGGLGGMSGHYVINKIYARGANRNYYIPGGAGDDGGFRCAKSYKNGGGK